MLQVSGAGPDRDLSEGIAGVWGHGRTVSKKLSDGIYWGKDGGG